MIEWRDLLTSWSSFIDPTLIGTLIPVSLLWSTNYFSSGASTTEWDVTLKKTFSPFSSKAFNTKCAFGSIIIPPSESKYSLISVNFYVLD